LHEVTGSYTIHSAPHVSVATSRRPKLIFDGGYISTTG
jgi:hypothetical protein